MTFSLGWSRRNALGATERVEFELVRRKATWRFRPARNEPREEFKPAAEDWEALFEVLERHLQRGKVSHEDVKIIRDLRQRAQ